MLRPVFFAAICGTVVGGMATADEDAIGKKLAAAKGEHEKVAEKARTGLIDTLKKKADAAQKAGDLNTLEKVEAETKAFEEKGDLPKSVPTKTYESELRRARARLEDAYATAVKEYTKAGQRTQAKVTQQELDDFKKGGASAAAEKWTPLFNGKDLTGWKIPNPPGPQFKGVREKKNEAGKVVAFVGQTKDGKDVILWRVENGLLIGGGLASNIFSDAVADNFRYRVEAKINDHGNSGQHFRAQFGPGIAQGYEAQINATHSDPIRTGSLYRPFIRKLSKEDQEKMIVLKAPHEPDEFFTQEVVADRNHIQIFVNGKQTVDYTDRNNPYWKGHFGLQGYDPGSVVTFRKVEYMPLKK